jgi:hypothetical protein
MMSNKYVAIAPPVAPLACPKCARPFGSGPGELVEQSCGAYRIYATCVGCDARLWLYLGSIDANGVGVTHLVPLS